MEKGYAKNRLSQVHKPSYMELYSLARGSFPIFNYFFKMLPLNFYFLGRIVGCTSLHLVFNWYLVSSKGHTLKEQSHKVVGLSMHSWVRQKFILGFRLLLRSHPAQVGLGKYSFDLEGFLVSTPPIFSISLLG